MRFESVETFRLVVNRGKTKVLDMRADKSALGFLGYEFRYVKDRRYGTGGNYLTYGPSMKSVKKVCAKVKEQILSIFKPVKNEEVEFSPILGSADELFV